MALLETMKKVAEQSQNANVPAAFLFGNVTATSPLTIRVDNRFDITGEAIVVMKEFRAGYYPTHRHSGFADSPTTQPKGGGSGDPAKIADDVKTAQTTLETLRTNHQKEITKIQKNTALRMALALSLIHI